MPRETPPLVRRILRRFCFAASTLTRSWLNQRQVRHVQRHRDKVPEAFRAQIDLAAHQKAADYTVASARIGRWDTLLDAAVACC